MTNCFKRPTLTIFQKDGFRPAVFFPGGREGGGGESITMEISSVMLMILDEISLQRLSFSYFLYVL